MLRSRVNNILLPRVVLPLADLLTSNKGWRYYKEYLASDREPAAERRRRQWRRVQRLLDHAYRNTLYYRDLMDSVGLTPERIRAPEDLRRLPVTTKHDLRREFPDRIVARDTDLSRVRVSNTSGTAGRPLVLVQDHDDINRKYASKLRTRHLMGVSVGDRVLRLAPNECQPCFRDGSSPDVGALGLLKMWLTRHPDFAQARYIFMERRVINPLVHQRDFPPPLASDLLDEGVDRYLSLITRRRPEVLAGHPLYLYLVAREAEQRGETIRGIKAVDCTGDLSTTRLRGYLARQLNAPVYQIYGGCEWGRVAGSCAQSDGLMHMLDDLVFVEFLDPDGQPVEEGVPGNVIVTCLTNRAMPLIRFEHGDVGWYTDEPCACGRTTRRMYIEGRLQAVVIPPGREPVFSSALVDRLIPNPGVSLFKVTQLAADRFEVVYLPDRRHPLDAEALRAELREVLGHSCQVDIKATEKVEPAPSGKFRLVQSTSYQSFRCVGEEKRSVALGEYW